MHFAKILAITDTILSFLWTPALRNKMLDYLKMPRDSITAFRGVTQCSVVQRCWRFRWNFAFPTSVSAGPLFLHLHAVASYDTSVLTRRHVPQNRDPTSPTLVSTFPTTNTTRCDQSLSLARSLSLSLIIWSYLCTRELCGGSCACWQCGIWLCSWATGFDCQQAGKIHENGARR